MILRFLIVFSLLVKIRSQDDQIQVFVNKISPFFNPVETYKYYDLAFCEPAKIIQDDQSIGESLSGDRRVNTAYQIKFKQNFTQEKACQKELSIEQIQEFQSAISENYIIEFQISYNDAHRDQGDLGDQNILYDIVGQTQDGTYFLKNHIQFELFYEDQKIKFMNITAPVAEDFIDITQLQQTLVDFKYSVVFKQYDKFDNSVLIDQDEKQQTEIFWISIINGFILVTALIVFMIVTLEKALRKDFSALLDLEQHQQDIKWRLIKNEVFYAPPYINLFSSFIGIGVQFLVLTIALILLESIGLIYGHHQEYKTIALLLYCFTGTINGYMSAKHYKYFGGRSWATNIMTSATLFPFFNFLIWSFLNSIAWQAGSTAAVPFFTILYILFIWTLVYIPLTIFGGLTARMICHDVLPHVNEKLPRLKREIPFKKWYQRSLLHIILAGFLPCSAIYLELYFIFSSFWGHYHYHFYGVLVITFVLMLIVVACISICLTYFTLNAQDYKWWWKSFLYGGSPSIAFFVYSIYFYYAQSNMFGYIQFSFYFGNSIILSLISFLMLGSYGFLCSKGFVMYIYERSKIL